MQLHRDYVAGIDNLECTIMEAGTANLSSYTLDPLLRLECELVNLQLSQVQQNLLARRHRRENSELQNRLEVMWEEYSVNLSVRQNC